MVTCECLGPLVQVDHDRAVLEHIAGADVEQSGASKLLLDLKDTK